jgi:hypothetical protein
MRTLEEKVRALLYDSGLPEYCWTDAIHHAAYLINRTPSSANGDKSPYEKLFREKVDLSVTPLFGQKLMIPKKVKQSDKATTGKLTPKATAVRFLYPTVDVNGKKAFIVRERDKKRV